MMRKSMVICLISLLVFSNIIITSALQTGEALPDRPPIHFRNGDLQANETPMYQLFQYLVPSRELENTSWNRSLMPPLLDQPQFQDPALMRSDRPFSPFPGFEMAGAYIVFLLLFGLSSILLLLLSFAGRRMAIGYMPDASRKITLFFTSGYLVLGISTAFISVPLLTLVTGQLISGNPALLAGFTSFCVVSLILSSFALSYASYSRRSFPFILIVHPIISVILIAISLTVHEQQSGLPGLAPMTLLVFILSGALPLYQSYLMKKRQQEIISSVTMVAEGSAPQIKITNRLPHELNNRYMNAELVGSGGMALVFRAKRIQDGRTVAVKVPTRYDEVTGYSFLREMGIWKSLSHPHIVEVFSYNILPVPYVEMEYLSPTLAEVEKPLPPHKTLQIIRGIAEGIGYAHASGVIHRDIKPGNILLTQDGSPKITDWGLGKEIADRNETRYIAFSLDYASPEQISPRIFGSGDARIDIFQLGMVFYELLTGKKPFDGEGMGDVTFSILMSDPLPPSEHSPELSPYDAIILKCLRKNPDDRYQFMEEFLQDFRALQIEDDKPS